MDFQPSFTWGQVIRRIQVDMDDTQIEVVKFHPWEVNGTVLVGSPDLSKIEYHIEDMSMSFNSMQSLMIAWIANRNLGLNQHALVAGVCRALDIDKFEERAIFDRTIEQDPSVLVEQVLTTDEKNVFLKSFPEQRGAHVSDILDDMSNSDWSVGIVEDLLDSIPATDVRVAGTAIRVAIILKRANPKDIVSFAQELVKRVER
jgi:hypothetical protein